MEKLAGGNNDKKEVLLPEYLKMYEISGQDLINEHIFNRYQRDKTRNDGKITSLIKEEETKPLSQKIKEGLESSNPEVQRISARMIGYAPEEERAPLHEILLQKIKQGLDNPNPEVQKEVAWMIDYAPDEERTPLIKQGLDNPNPEVQRISARMIGYAPEEERAPLHEILLQKIKQGLDNPNSEVQRISARMIGYAPEEERAPLHEILLQKIKQGLDNPNPEVQRISAGMIRYAPETERDGVFTLATEKGLGEYLIQPPLYEKGNVTKERFSRTKFDKTGSETILLGGELKDKTIIREITPRSFLAWQKIYEDWELWKQAGFDYVPIEPIQSFDVTQSGLVRVYSGVLDLSLFSFNRITPRFQSDLIIQRNTIEKVLKDQNIEHGHTHEHNFCLRFFRDTNGQPDFSRVPRLYLIDFDQAVSPQR